MIWGPVAYNSPVAPIGCGRRYRSSTTRPALGSATPMRLRESEVSTSVTDRCTVVSVMPYMLTKRTSGCRECQCDNALGSSASPPNNTRRNDSGRSSPGSCTSREKAVGV